jgi:alkyl sulfatase BDS1-like metallo-beta-lactamase superfamily hydrolase
MQTRRNFIKTVPITSGAFAVGGSFMLENALGADETAILRAEPHKGHFHPKGKAPSVHTVRVLKEARASLPFADESDFEEWDRGFIAAPPELQIMADTGNVALDMAKFKFLDQREPFDSIHPSLHRIGRLNNNYGLYQVAPGVYQNRADLERVMAGEATLDALIADGPAHGDAMKGSC